MNLPTRMRLATLTAGVAAALALTACGDRQGPAAGKATPNGPTSSTTPPGSTGSASGSTGAAPGSAGSSDSGSASSSPPSSSSSSSMPPSSSSSSSSTMPPPSSSSSTPPSGSGATPPSSSSNTASTKDMKKSAATAGDTGTSGASSGTSSGTTGAAGTNRATTPSGATGRAAASSSTGSAAPANTAIGRTEKDFLTKVAASGKAEVEAAKIAAEKATTPGVKQFAEKMVEDHTAANDELMKLAQAKGVTLPPAQADHGDHAGAIKRIANAKGADVDRQFLRGFGSDEHKKDIQAFERAARESNDAEVRAFAEKTLPKLREHQQMAQQLQGQMGKGTGSTSSNRAGTTQTSQNTVN